MDCLASNDYLLSAGNRRVDCVRLSWWEATAPLPPPQGEVCLGNVESFVP